jgi:phosphatidylserine/phosphatidylglycerophosphate/cardiolipin synthase-like enzyme/uncharacterized membrane protein YdjX (TVP38/TMEM64 family)
MSSPSTVTRLPEVAPVRPTLRPAPAARFPAATGPSGRIESIFRPGENCWRVERAHRVAMLVDGVEYFRAFREAALRAERSIFVLAWDFASATELVFDQPDDGAPTTLGPFLDYLVRRNRHLHVNVLDWDFPIVFGRDRELAPLYGFGWRPHRRVHVRLDNTHPVGGSHHQKVAVIDDRIAFVGGLDLTCRRWDTPEHKPDDPRRMAYGKPYAPFHDMMMLVEGNAARALGELCRERWRLATGKRLPLVGPTGCDVWPPSARAVLSDVDVAIARTAPPTDEAPVVREIEQLYLDMIARARRTIYIENQYFTAASIGDALAARLAEEDGPEVVLVMRLLSHGWLEEATMHVLRARLIRQLREADRHGRVHVYTPDIAGLDAEHCVDVHAKLIIIDDEILRIGSANLCNRSMGMDTECDLAIEARGDPAIAREIRRYREKLIAEHVGASPERVAAECDARGSLHRAIAALGTERRRLAPLEDVPEWSDPIHTLAGVADPERPVSFDRLLGEMSVGRDDPGREGPAWKKLLATAVVVAGLAALWRFTPLADWVTAENVTGLAQSFASRPWAPALLMVAYTPASFVLFPRPLITLASVVAFGPWLGLGYATVGILLAAAITYGMGRLMSRDTVRRLAGRKLNKLTDLLRRRGLIAVTIMRLVPAAPFAVENFIAGAARIRFRDYLGGTVLGMAPGVLALTVFGKEVEASLKSTESMNWWLVGGVALAVCLLTFFVRRWFARWSGHDEAPDGASPRADGTARADR